MYVCVGKYTGMFDINRLTLPNKLSSINSAFEVFPIDFDYKIHILKQLEQSYNNASCDIYRNTKETEYVDLEITVDNHIYN